MANLGIIAEDISDIDTLSVLARRINTTRYKIKKYSAKGGAKILRKCSAVASQWVKVGVNNIIVCHDLDCNDNRKCEQLHKNINNKMSIIPNYENIVCIVIPIQEIEAWLLADTAAINSQFARMKLKEIPNPEVIESPKEYIEKRSKGKNCKPRYINAIHNQEIALKVDISKIRHKCPAFLPFHDFISNIS